MRFLIVLIFVAVVAQALANSAEDSDEATYRPIRGQYPHMVHLRTPRNNGAMFTCGGSLIHPRWVLTAARCVNDIASGSVATFFWMRFIPEDVIRPGLVLETNQGLLNPRFDGINHDVALVNLNRYIHSIDDIRPVRLQRQTVSYPVGETFNFCSWGLTEDRTRPATELRCSEMASASLLSSCPVPPFPFQNLICALGPAACDSELGSPLVIAEDGGLTQIGLLAYGPGNCANPGPTIKAFTQHRPPRLAQYSDKTTIKQQVRHEDPTCCMTWWKYLVPRQAYTRISLYSDWIAEVTGLDPSPPAGNETAFKFHL